MDCTNKLFVNSLDVISSVTTSIQSTDYARIASSNTIASVTFASGDWSCVETNMANTFAMVVQ
jgi:hypothetical protein